MNLTRFFNSSEVVFKLLFLWLINFDSIFGCLPMDFKKRDALIPKKDWKEISSDDGLESLKDIPSYAEKLLIKKFSEFMSETTKMKLTKRDFEFLWIKVNQFKRLRKKMSRKEKLLDNDLSNRTYVGIENITAFLNSDKTENPLVGVLNAGETTKVISKVKGRYYDRTEKNSALLSARSFYNHACKSTNRTFCVDTYIKQQQNINDIHQFLPPAFLVKRCPGRCSCIQPNEECLPTSIQTRVQYSVSIDFINSMSTWPLVLTDHTDCKCRDRCNNRKCIEHFHLTFTKRGVCKCECIHGSHTACTNIHQGQKKFSDSDYKCIVNGTCIAPTCEAGELSEENLYLRRCPTVLY